MSTKKSARHRSAVSGRFVTPAKAARRPATTVRERVRHRPQLAAARQAIRDAVTALLALDSILASQ